MKTELQEPQESELEPTTADEAVADTTSTPDVTEGVSASDAVAEDERTPGEKARDEFLEKYGEEEPEAEETPAEQEPKAEEEPDPAEATRKDDSEDEHRLEDEVFKKLPEPVKQRIGHLNARAKKAERRLEEQSAEVETYKDSHQRFNTLQTYVQENNIQPENVTKAFDIMARLSKGDFEGFLTEIQPWVDLAQQATGKVYAPDLQDRIDNGYITEDVAVEITQARKQKELAEARAAQLKTVDDTRTAEAAATENVNSIVNAVNAREAEIRSSDPDYAHKAAKVKQLVNFALSNGVRLDTPAAAVKMVNDAYAAANAEATKPQAPRPKTPPRPTSSTTARGQVQAASLEEALSQAAESYVPQK